MARDAAQFAVAGPEALARVHLLEVADRTMIPRLFGRFYENGPEQVER